MTLRRLRSGEDAGWFLMPQTLQRIAAFCQTQPTELDAADLLLRTKALFIGDSPDLGLWVAHDKHWRVVAHLLACFLGATKTVFLYQLQIDQALPAKLRHDAIEEVETWARSRGAHAIDASTWHTDKATAWLRRYGFTSHRLILRRSVTHGE